MSIPVGPGPFAYETYRANPRIAQHPEPLKPEVQAPAKRQLPWWTPSTLFSK